MHGQEVHVGDQLVLQPASGWARFMHHHKTVLDRASAGVVYTDAGGQTRTFDLAGHQTSYGLAKDGASLSVTDGSVELNWQLALGTEIQLRLEVRNVGSHPVRIHELGVLDVETARGGFLGVPSPSNWRFFQAGWQSWTPAYARHVNDGMWVNPNTVDYRTKHQPHPVPETGKTLSSEWFTVIAPEPRERSSRSALPELSLLLGFVTTAHQLAEIRLDAQSGFQRLRAASYADGCSLAPGERLCSETLLLAFGDEPMSLLDLYAARLGEMMGARLPSWVPTGWCTWYYYFGEEKADDVLANLKTIDQERLALDVILIDDGYESAIGDWLDVQMPKYPQGLQGVARQIRASGRRPGIWTAPFGLAVSSKLYADHPDWALRNEEGVPVLAWQHFGTDVLALDLTLPEVQDWLRETFRTLAEDWGFEFFKVDFAYAAALPGVRHDPHVTRAQALRRGLEIIREAIGERFLLGCGAPLGPCVGVVDAMRVGTDVSTDWRPLWPDLSSPATSNALLNVVTRSHSHGRWWLNDPDCLLLREKDHESNLTPTEVRTLVTIVGLSGGLVLDGDNLPTLGRDGLDYLRRVLPPSGRCATPIDLFVHERPERWVLPIKTSWGTWALAALLNWEDKPRTTRVDLSTLGLPARRYHVYDFWHRRYLGVERGEIVIEAHRPHEAILLLVKPVSEQPQLLTSTFHITQGAAEVKNVRRSEKGLVVELEKAGTQSGQLLFAVPAEEEHVRARVNGRARKLRSIAPGIWELGFTLVDKASVELLLGE